MIDNKNDKNVQIVDTNIKYHEWQFRASCVPDLCESSTAKKCARAGSGNKGPLQVTLNIVMDHAQTRQVY